MEGWNNSLLPKVAFIQEGPGIRKYEYDENGYPMINVRCVQDGYVDMSTAKAANKELAYGKWSHFQVQEGDILFTISGTIGRSAMVKKEDLPLLMNTSVVRFRASVDDLDQYFLYYFLKTPNFIQELKNLATGTAQKNVGPSHLKQIKISYPPIDEQKRIVAILDETFDGIDAAIANTQKNLANARELFESYLNGVFTQKGEGWVETKLGEVCSIKHGFAFKSEFFTNEETDYIVLTPGSFNESGGYRDPGEKTKYYMGDIPDGFILKEGDFLFAMTEQAVGLLGSSLIVPESDRFLHNQRLGLVQVGEDVEWHNDFFFHQFNTISFRWAVQSSASGVKVRHTSPKKLGAISVCFPPTLSEQKLLAHTLNELAEEIHRLESIYQRKLEALKELKQSILEKAFTGELTGDVAKEVANTSKEIAA